MTDLGGGSREIDWPSLADLFAKGTDTWLNDRGEVLRDHGYNVAVLWRAGKLEREIHVPSGHTFIQVDAFNDRGEVAFESTPVKKDRFEAFLWRAGQRIGLGRLGGSKASTYPTALNNKGVVVGKTGGPFLGQVFPTHGLHWQGFVWRGGVMTGLGLQANPLAINDRQMIVGYCGTRVPHPCRWHGGTTTHIGRARFRGVAQLVNARGQILVYYRYHWFESDRGGLPSRLPGLAGRSYVRVAALNDKGIIVGQDDHQRRAVVWTVRRD